LGCQTKIPHFIKLKYFVALAKTMARLKLAALDTIFLFYQKTFIFKENGCYIHTDVWMSFLVEVVSAFYLKNRSSDKKDLLRCA